MTSVGVKWENGVLEAGITACTRVEFDEHLRKIEAVALLAWPAGNPVPDLSRDPAEPPEPGLFDASFGGTADPVGWPLTVSVEVAKATAEADRTERQRRWKERQGL